MGVHIHDPGIQTARSGNSRSMAICRITQHKQTTARMMRPDSLIWYADRSLGQHMKIWAPEILACEESAFCESQCHAWMRGACRWQCHHKRMFAPCQRVSSHHLRSHCPTLSWDGRHRASDHCRLWTLSCPQPVSGSSGRLPAQNFKLWTLCKQKVARTSNCHYPPEVVQYACVQKFVIQALSLAQCNNAWNASQRTQSRGTWACVTAKLVQALCSAL